MNVPLKTSKGKKAIATRESFQQDKNATKNEPVIITIPEMNKPRRDPDALKEYESPLMK